MLATLTPRASANWTLLTALHRVMPSDALMLHAAAAAFAAEMRDAPSSQLAVPTTDENTRH